MAVFPTASVERRTVEEWEREVGEQVRELRIRAGLTQATLADHADVALNAVKGLESGRGSAMSTVIKVLRVLGRDSWLSDIAPVVRPMVSPMAQLREHARQPNRRQRVRPSQTR